MATNRQNNRFFWVMLVGLLLAAYVGLMFVTTGTDCPETAPKHWVWFPPRWECGGY